MKILNKTEIFFGDEHFEWMAYPQFKWIYFKDHKELYLGIWIIALIKIIQHKG